MSSEKPYIDRSETTEFVKLLRHGLQEPSSMRVLFHAYGIGGVGKTSLLGQIERDCQGVAIAKVSFGLDSGIENPLELMDNPQESALILADGNITLGDLLLGERYPNLDEVFLSACETHVGNFTLTDDVTTLTTGFLCVGARSVQSTLWKVNDLVTTGQALSAKAWPR